MRPVCLTSDVFQAQNTQMNCLGCRQWFLAMFLGLFYALLYISSTATDGHKHWPGLSGVVMELHNKSIREFSYEYAGTFYSLLPNDILYVFALAFIWWIAIKYFMCGTCKLRPNDDIDVWVECPPQSTPWHQKHERKVTDLNMSHSPRKNIFTDFPYNHHRFIINQLFHLYFTMLL